jgi:AcrR family transcriptional regulator
VTTPERRAGPTRRGRRPGGNSDDTRQKILDVALAHFAERGYASTTLTAIAAEVGLATSGVYHYYDGKESLYEAVFFATAPQVWDGIADSMGDAPTMLAGIETLLRDRGGTRRPYASAFLAGMPTVATLHPEFAHLLQARTKYQDPVFRALAETGLRTGELTGLDLDEATAVLRAFLMGWFFERHFDGPARDDTVPAVLQAFRLMAADGRTSVSAGS